MLRRRLLRVDPAGGGAEIVASARRHSPDAIPLLSVDRDGFPLLALADGKHFKLLHVFAHPHGYAVGRVRNERGRLVRAPIVDEHGYSFVLADDDGALRILRRPTLRPVSCEDESEEVAAARHASASPKRQCDTKLLDSLL